VRIGVDIGQLETDVRRSVRRFRYKKLRCDSQLIFTLFLPDKHAVAQQMSGTIVIEIEKAASQPRYGLTTSPAVMWHLRNSSSRDCGRVMEYPGKVGFTMSDSIKSLLQIHHSLVAYIGLNTHPASSRHPQTSISFFDRERCSDHWRHKYRPAVIIKVRVRTPSRSSFVPRSLRLRKRR